MEAASSRRSGWTALGRAAIGIGIAIWVLSRVPFSRDLVSRLWIPIAVFAAIGPLGVLVEAIRLRWIVGIEGIALSLAGAARIVLVSALFAVAVPGGTGGDVVKLYYLGRERQQRLVELGTLVLVDRAVAMSALMFLVSLLAPFLPRGTFSGPAGAFLGLGAALGVGLVLAGLLLVPVADRLTARLGDWGTGVLGWPARILTSLSRFRVRRRLLLRMFSVASLGHASMLCSFAFAAVCLFGSVDVVLAASLAAVGFVANALPATPGGIGVGEAAFEHLFQLAGMQGAALLLFSWRIGCVPIWAAGFLVYLAGSASARQIESHESSSAMQSRGD